MSSEAFISPTPCAWGTRKTLIPHGRWHYSREMRHADRSIESYPCLFSYYHRMRVVSDQPRRSKRGIPWNKPGDSLHDQPMIDPGILTPITIASDAEMISDD